MTTQQFAWHALRLLLAAVFLWWDLRLFLFYAFTMILAVLCQIERLRAIVRVFNISTEVKVLAIAEALSINESPIDERYRRTRESWPEERRKSLDGDWSRAMGEGYIARQ